MSSATTAAPTNAKQPPKKPYSIWFHPFVTWTDFFLSHLLPWFLPLGKLSTRHSAITQDGQEANAKVQQKFCKMSNMGFHNQCRKLSKNTKTLMVTCTCKIPRSATILHEWNIIDESDALLQQVVENEKDGFVKVLVCCPASLVDREETANESKGGVVEVDSFDLKSIPKHVPILLWFHGGGLTLGTCHCTGLMDVASRLLQNDPSQDVVFVSVDYRLAPDCKLPAASVDALAAADYLLKDGRNIHVSGESAGAYLATVTAFAAHSRYPGQVQSAYIRIPFLSPAADSMSYYMNGPACIAAPVSWLRWCWRAALDMPENDEDVVSDDIVAVGSNRTAWNQSKWKRNAQWRRFLEPLEGVPSNLGTTRYIVGVSKADTLYDEGMELVKKLEQNGANVTCVDSLGSHVFGFETDPNAYNALVDAWRSEVFGDDKQE